MNALTEVDTLLFDMDGTLTNLGKRWIDPFFRAFDQIKPDYDKVKRQEVFEWTLGRIVMTSQGSSKLLKIGTFWKAIRWLNLSFIEIFRALKLIKSDPMAFKDIEPLEGVEEILKVLQNRGYKLALVTSAGDKTVGRAKKELEMLNSFDTIITRNSVKKIKPYPDSLLLACEILNKKPANCAMIGDFPQDVEAGKAAGTKTISVLGLNGEYTGERIRQMNPDVLLSSIHELPSVLPGIQN